MLSLSRAASRASLRDDDSDIIEDWRRRWRRCEPLHRLCGDESPLALLATVGEDRDNRRRDVAKAQLMLERLGLYGLERVDGPTGLLDRALLEALRRLQHDHKLRADGWMRPDGPTHCVMGGRLGHSTAADAPTGGPSQSERS